LRKERESLSCSAFGRSALIPIHRRKGALLALCHHDTSFFAVCSSGFSGSFVLAAAWIAFLKSALLYVFFSSASSQGSSSSPDSASPLASLRSSAFSSS
jgi:hypothetical protein